MHTAVKIVSFLGIGAGLFVGSYVGFAKIVGADMGRLVGIGSMFQPLAEAGAGGSGAETDAGGGEASEAGPGELSQSLARNLRAPQRAASIIDFFTVPAPFTTEELKRHSDQLLAAADRLDLREHELDRRESDLAERQNKLDEDFATLVRLQKSLDDMASELRMRQEELDRDVDVRLTNEAQVHERIGELFLEGDPEDLVPRLGMFEPAEAAKILVTLPPERANELLAVLESDERWLEYAQAFAVRAAEQKAATPAKR